MKKLSLFLALFFVLTCITSTASRSSNKLSVKRTSVVVHAVFWHGGYTLSLCITPNMRYPSLLVDGEYEGAIACPESTLTADLIEGQEVQYTAWIGFYTLTHTVTSPVHVVTAAEITDGHVYVYMPSMPV
jgi:hypothetical protein